MPAIRNSELIKRFTDFFKLKTNDMLGSEAGRMLVPVVTEPIPVNIKLIQDLTLNDSNKSFFVPAGKQWKILYGNIELITTATVGDRQIEFSVRLPNGRPCYIVRAAVTQAASLTEQYTLGQFGDVAQTVDGRHTIPIPVNLIVDENFEIRILDTSAVAAAADDLSIVLNVEEIEVTGE